MYDKRRKREIPIPLACDDTDGSHWRRRQLLLHLQPKWETKDGKEWEPWHQEAVQTRILRELILDLVACRWDSTEVHLDN